MDSKPKLAWLDGAAVWEWIEDGERVRIPAISGGGGGGTPAPPPPTPAETALTQAQTADVEAQTKIAQQQLDLSQQAFTQQQAFGDFLLAQSGYQRDPKTGAISQIPGSTAAEIQNLTQQRYLAALEGNLPVDPALERNLAEQEQTLRSSLEKNLGPGYETSTAGITALADYNQRANEARYAARTGDLTTAANLAAQQRGQLTGGLAAASGAYESNLANLSGASGTFGSAASTAGLPLASLTNQRLLQYQYELQNAAAKQQGLESLVTAGAYGVGSGAIGGVGPSPFAIF